MIHRISENWLDGAYEKKLCIQPTFFNKEPYPPPSTKLSLDAQCSEKLGGQANAFHIVYLVEKSTFVEFKAGVGSSILSFKS